MPEFYFLLLYNLRVSLFCEHPGKVGNVWDDIRLLASKLDLERILASFRDHRTKSEALQRKPSPRKLEVPPIDVQPRQRRRVWIVFLGRDRFSILADDQS